jgi:23S rRNA (adenine2503-C2)-methyltransferase
MKTLIHGLTHAEIARLCADRGAPAYRADQIWQWLYRKWAADWSEMRNLPAALREELAGAARLDSATAVKVEGEKGGTRKLLVALADGEQIEEVLIPAPGRRTVCLSSQVGCRFNCAFCASGKAGFRRNLLAGEMVGQVVLAVREYGERPTHVVVMGIGEPLDNYDEVIKAIRIINDADGLAIGARRITISTCGIVPGIARLAGEGLQVELSVSLHAADDATRSKLMPVNRKYPIENLLAACRDYAAGTGRIITFEYTLIRGVNDAPRQAAALAKRLRTLPCRVNLIPLSAVDEFDGRRAAPAVAGMFVATLARAGINATVRASKGSDVQAACGQLRLRHLIGEAPAPEEPASPTPGVSRRASREASP